MKYKGTICTFIPNRKFGFIKTDGGGEVFFHQMNFERGVPVLGQRVEFELGPSVRLGMPEQAVNVVAVHEVFDILASTSTSTEVAK